MLTRPFLTTLLCAAALSLATPGRTQTPPAPAPAAPGPPPFAMGPPVRSPEVTADGHVTFRLHAPDARQVILTREGGPPAPMVKDDRGVWSVTVGPLAPDFYWYTFQVDGVSLPDPADPLAKGHVTGAFESLAHVPGPPSLSWEWNPAVPHGVVHHHVYQSAIVGEPRDIYVYTPPGYDPNGKTRYPVLYLLHGLTDDATAWTTAGRENVILDNLIAAGKAKPMIVVNTLGYGLPHPDRDLFALFAPANQQKNRDQFRDILLTEVIPQVEKGYRVATERESRAIAGLSMGGAQSASIGLNHLDRFAWIGTFSAAFVMLDAPEKTFPDLTAADNARIRLLWMACGTEDGLISSNRATESWLRDKGIRLTAVETPGAHTWLVWRRNLTAFAPLLFRGPGD